MSKSILLLSNSYQYGANYLTHYTEPIKAFLKGIKLIIFVPYATDEEDWDAYTQAARDFFNSLGIALLGIHQVPEDRIFTDFEAIFIGGGDVFRLRDKLLSENLASQIRSAVLSGRMLYLGVSAGANIAGQTIYTTKAISIPANSGFEGINLFSFQVNPHYISSEPKYNSNVPLVALSAGSYLSVDIDLNKTKELFLGGNTGAKVFFRGKEPIEIKNSSKFILSNDSIEVQKTIV